MSDWIRVKEKCPDFLEDVLVCYLDKSKEPMMTIAFKTRSLAGFYDGLQDVHLMNVTHWMPLPEMPEE